MLRKCLTFKTLFPLKSQALCENASRPYSFKLITSYESLNEFLYRTSFPQLSRKFHFSSLRSKAEDRREMLASMPAKDEGTEGEKTVDIDTLLKRKYSCGNRSIFNDGDGLFPDENTPKQLFNGVPFEELPIFNIKVSPNNTIISVTDYKGVVKLMRSCGVEGFKNTRKGTNVAAQATAISITTKALEHGFKTVRVRVRGLGPGRMSAIKGLQMGGLDIVSVTDYTPVSWKPPRPRKQKKL